MTWLSLFKRRAGCSDPAGLPFLKLASISERLIEGSKHSELSRVENARELFRGCR